jgi:N-acetylglucosaminyl transferase component (Gpi1)
MMTTPTNTTTTTTKIDPKQDFDASAAAATMDQLHPDDEYHDSCRLCRILVWPDSLRRCHDGINKSGFLIGWSSLKITDDDDDDVSVSLSAAAVTAAACHHPTTLVVAGLVQMLDADDDDDDDALCGGGSTKQQQQQQQQQQLMLRARIENQIQKIQASLLLLLLQTNQQHSSFSQTAHDNDDSKPSCKTDTSTTSPTMHDASTTCWGDLRVIAWYDPDPTYTSTSLASAVGLPRISPVTVSNIEDGSASAGATGMQNGNQQYPWFALNHDQHFQQDKNNEECQVIFYNDDDSAIYTDAINASASSSSSSATNSSMSFYSILPRITNASQIMKIIHSSLSLPEGDDEAIRRRLGGPTLCHIIHASPDQKAEQDTTDDPSSPLDKMDASFWRRPCRFVYKRSFLLWILGQLSSDRNRSTRAIPLLRFVHALKLHKQPQQQQQQQQQQDEDLRTDGDEAKKKNQDDSSNLYGCWPSSSSSKHSRMQRLVHCWDEAMLAGLDAVMGIILASIIIRSYWLYSSSLHNPASGGGGATSSSSSWSLDVMIKSHFQFLWDCTVWLESFPIGFKLNEQLTAILGHKIRSLMTLYQWLLLQVITTRNTLVVQAGATVLSSFIALVFGAFGLMALVMDVFLCAMVHVSFFAYLFGSIVRAELYLLAALWRLFRGKKRNPLRRRTDTMEYDSLQLLVGIIVFSVSLFLFPTIGIYHAFFAALNLVMVVSVSFTCILLCIVLWKKFPWGRLLLRYCRPGWFTKGVYLAAEMHHHDTVASTLKSNVISSWTVDVTRLQTIPCSYSSILMDGLVHRNPAMTNLMAWLLKQLLDPWRSTSSLLHDDEHCLAFVFETLMEPCEDGQ